MFRHHGLLLWVTFWVTTASGTETLYKIEAGPLDVQIIEALTVRDPVQGREISLRLLYPGEAGQYPLVVFSTGAFCYPQMYDAITAHWVSHGYIVIVPNHLESPNNASRPTPDQYPDFLPSRVRDMSFVLDVSERIMLEAKIEAKINMDQVAVAGHSFGAVISMIKMGLGIKDEFRGAWGELIDERFQAAVLLSAPGSNMEELVENAYAGISRPFIATGGTNDIGRVDPGDLSAAEWRMQVYQLAPPGDKYSLITEGSDHYLGGLICNAERGGEPDHAAVRNVRAVTTAFLDAYIKRSDRAQTFLHDADILQLSNGQARFQSR